MAATGMEQEQQERLRRGEQVGTFEDAEDALALSTLLPATTAEVATRKQRQRQRTLDELSLGPIAPAPMETLSSPRWLQEARKAYPVVQDAEFHALLGIFSSYATPPTQQGIITKEAMRLLLDETLRDFFNKIDVDGSGTLDHGELMRLMRMLETKMDDQHIEQTIRDLDSDADGEVSWEEFRSWWMDRDAQSRAEHEQELDDLFAQVDTNFSGTVDWNEFLEMIGRNLEKEDVRKVSTFEDVSKVSVSTTPTARDASRMVREALEAVKADVRAIYGTLAHPKTQLHLRSQQSQEALERRCAVCCQETRSYIYGCTCM